LPDLLRLALPLIVSNLFFTVQISIDRLFLSWHDAAATGAAFAGAMLFWAPMTLAGNTAGFTATFVAQYLGAGRRERIGPLVQQALWFSIVAGMLFLLLIPWCGALPLWAGHETGLAALESQYLFCLCFCALPMIVNAALTGTFAALNRPHLVIWVNVLGCVVNAVLDYVLIFGVGGLPAFGIAGAGWATVAASYASMLLALALWWQPEFAIEFGSRRSWRVDSPLLRRYLGFAVPNGLQGGIDVVAWTVFTMLVGRLGSAALAATSIVMVVNACFFIPMLGLAQAVCVQVGQRLGEDRPDLAARSAWLGFGVAGSVMTLLGVTVALLPGVFIAIFRSREAGELWEQTAALIPGLLWFVALYSFFDSMNLVFAFALRGAGDTRFVSLATLVCGVGLLILPGWYVIELGGGIHAAWGFATLYIAGLAFTFLARFLWGPWRSLRVIEPAPLAA
jgi:MATE family multidrug resistance protein